MVSMAARAEKARRPLPSALLVRYRLDARPGSGYQHPRALPKPESQALTLTFRIVSLSPASPSRSVALLREPLAPASELWEHARTHAPAPRVLPCPGDQRTQGTTPVMIPRCSSFGAHYAFVACGRRATETSSRSTR